MPATAPHPFGADGGYALFRWPRDMRDHHPLWRDPGGFWNVFRYADVRDAASDLVLFSSDTSSVIPSMSHLQRGTLTRMDPTEYHKLRRLISHCFSSGWRPPSGRRSGGERPGSRRYVSLRPGDVTARQGLHQALHPPFIPMPVT
jgi:hypothetical protein